MFLRSRQQHKGFSLIEVLVSLSIFTIVVTICITTLYSLIDANARTRNVQSVVTNLSYTLDSMVRDIRTGTDYYCDGTSLPISGKATQDCPTGETLFSFNEGGRSLTKNASSPRIAYRLYDDNGRGVIQRRLGNDLWIDITAEDINITKLLFFVEGTQRSDTVSPIVTVFISGEVGDEAVNSTTFNIQATVPQLLIDL